MPTKSRNIALVLSSGGARGLAHIGVIDTLLERGYRITSIAGSSIGSLIGGLYATGSLDRYRDWVVGLDKLDVLRLLDFTLSAKGFVKGERVFNRMRKLQLIPDVNIEELPIPYAAVATDLVSNREVVFTSGSLIKAIRASIAIPAFFTPVDASENLYVDGGVLNPMPLNRVHRNPNDFLVAVDINALIPYQRAKTEQPEESFRIPGSKRIEALLRKWDEFIGHNHQFDDDKREKAKGMGYIDIIGRCVQLMQSQMTRHSLEVHKPDILIEISKNACSVFEFYRAQELIDHGREVCARKLDELGL